MLIIFLIDVFLISLNHL